MKKAGIAFGLAVVLSSLALTGVAHEKGDWIVRAGAATVNPDESSGNISTAATGSLPNTGASVGSDTQLGITVAYMVSDNIGLELLAATPFKHDVDAKGLGAYGFDTTDLGSVQHLPPTLVVQYYLFDKTAQLRPYAGIGLNYTTFFSESLSGFAKNELGAGGLSLDDSFGLALQVGVDWQLSERYVLNASIWNLDIDTEAEFNSALGRVKVDVDIDPWVYMLGVGYKF